TTPSYEYTPVDIGEDDDRFVIHLTPGRETEEDSGVSTGIDDVQEEDLDGIRITSRSGRAIVSINSDLLDLYGEGTIEVFTINGRQVSESSAVTSRTFIALPESNSAYIVRVYIGGLIKSETVMGSR
ncbi:hypothetical protein QA597_10665, partial [Marinilabiliaceae bacterium ANBcel2]|nr:hypothetical protein [Marinilabiliaceae bacterium ANBcel2]